MSHADRNAILSQTATLGITVPVPILKAWLEASQELQVLDRVDPISILHFTLADEMTPLRCLPIAQVPGFSKVGIIFDAAGVAQSIYAQDYESMSVELVTSNFDSFSKRPQEYIPNNNEELASPDSTINALSEELVPGADEEWNEWSLFKPFWLAIGDFVDETEDTFESIVASYGKPGEIPRIVRDVFPKPKSYTQPKRWFDLLRQLENLGHQELALRAMDNVRSLFLAGLDEDYASDWPQYHEDVQPYWSLLEREILLANRVNNAFDTELLKAILQNRKVD